MSPRSLFPPLLQHPAQLTFPLLGIYVSTLPAHSITEDLLILISGRPIPLSAISRSKISDSVLEVDVEKAWKELQMPGGGWSNEVGMEVFISPPSKA